MRFHRWSLGAAAALAVSASPALAQDYKDRLSVTVRGHATAPADEVAIELTVSASAEDAGEAEKRYRDKLNKVLAALGKGDAKAGDDTGTTKKKKKKAKDDDDADSPKKSDDDSKKSSSKKKKASDDDEDAPAPKKDAKKAADDDDEDAPKAKKDSKKKAADDDDDADAPKAKKKDDAKKDDKKDAKKDDAKKDDSKKDDAKKDDSKKDDAKKDDAKKDDAVDEKFPFVIEVKEGGLTFGLKGGDPNQQRMRRMMNGNQPVKDEPEFRFSSEVSVVFKNVAKAEPRTLRKRIANVLDKVSDSADMGLGTEGDGQPPLIRFAVTDVEGLRTKANQDAMAAARKRGGSLATLSERDLGKVVIVRDQTALPVNTRRPPYNPYNQGYGYNYGQVNPSTGEDWSTEVAVDVDLYVEFELKDKK